MTSLQSKFLFIGCLLLMVKISFLMLIYIIMRKIEKRAKLLKALEEKKIKAKTNPTPQPVGPKRL